MSRLGFGLQPKRACVVELKTSEPSGDAFQGAFGTSRAVILVVTDHFKQEPDIDKAQPLYLDTASYMATGLGASLL